MAEAQIEMFKVAFFAFSPCGRVPSAAVLDTRVNMFLNTLNRERGEWGVLGHGAGWDTLATEKTAQLCRSTA